MEPGRASPESEPLQEVEVSGERPGPGLWKIRRGANTVYILGTTSPLPRRVTFRSRELESVLARAGLFIPTRPSVDVKAGPFRLVGLYRDWRKLRVNPGGVGLDAVLPPELYARFSDARRRYAPRDRSMESKRPLIAAGEIYRAAIEANGLAFDSDVGDQVRKLARRAKVPSWEAEQRVDDPRAVLAEIGRVSPAAEQACLAATLTRIEQDLPSMRARALAWTVGDIEAMRSRTADDQLDACLGAIMGGPRMSAIAREFDQLWFDAVRRALETHQVALAVTPIQRLLRPDGVLAQFAALGYTVEAPSSE
ncbi:MAG: TraB/GumN family protein [Steroidobacteraceae bacterium]|nr:TraB/GumN family protein [Steroidobacteraceae bacterium]